MKHIIPAIGLLTAISAQGVTVLDTDFSTIPSEVTLGGGFATRAFDTSGAAPGGTGGGANYQFLDVTTVGLTGQWVHTSAASGTVTINLTGLGSHTGLDIGFFLAVGGGLDGEGVASNNDRVSVSVDGNVVFDNSFLARTFDVGARTQSFVAEPGVEIVAPASAVPDEITGANGTNFLTTREGAWGHDALYDLSLDSNLQNVPHTASTATIVITAQSLRDSGADGESNATDEQFAIANLSVDTVVPEPSAVLLSALGALSLLGRRRRA